MILGHRQRALGLVVLASTLVLGCSSQSGFPTAPSPVENGSATIRGQIRDGANDSVPDGLTVRVVGSTLSTSVDGTGRFTLENVTPGPVQLQFAGAGVDARLNVGPVQAGQVLSIQVTLRGGEAVLEEPSDAQDTSVVGALTALGGACPNVTFRVNGRLIRTSGATMFDDAGCAALSNGDRVRVDGFQQPDGSVQATDVEVDSPDDDESQGDDDPNSGDEIHPEGVLTNLGGACPNVTFRVNGILVRTSAATMFDDGGCAALANGDQVRVDGFQQPDGSVQATEVEVDGPSDDGSGGGGSDDDDPDNGDNGGNDDGEVNPEGLLTNLGGACPNVTFRVNGILVRTSAATMFDDGGCAALANGDQVRVDGFQQPDGSVQATEVEVDEADEETGDDPQADPLELDVNPDEWRLEWAQEGQGGSDTVRVRIRGSDAGQIDPSSITMLGPGGTVSPESTEVDDDFEAEFATEDAIAIVGGAQDGDTVQITVQGQLVDGTPLSLPHVVEIRE